MKFSCPNCEKEIFEAVSITRAINDFKGNPCPICGYRIKEEDIKSADNIVQLTRNTFIRADIFR